MSLGWKSRIGIVLSLTWLCLALLFSVEEEKFGLFLLVGILPLLLIWGVVWTIAGWRRQQSPQGPKDDAALAIAKVRRTKRWRTVLAVSAILVFGILAAHWQASIASNDAVGEQIPRWLGEWLVYGFVVWIIVRMLPRIPSGIAIIASALTMVGGVNFIAYSVIAEGKEELALLTRAMPIIQKMQSGTPVSDDEVKAAGLGLLEPLILVNASYGRDLIAAQVTLQTRVDAVQPELMLTPTSLASPDIRSQTKLNLEVIRQASAEYQMEVKAATARAKVALQGARSQMPSAMVQSVLEGFDRTADQLSAFLRAQAEAQESMHKTILGIVRLLDDNPRMYVVDPGPPERLLFRSQALLTRYSALMDELLTASRREQQAREQLADLQTEFAAQVGRVFDQR
jgi:hypothetical protein